MVEVKHHERVFRVRHNECDAYGHVNNTHYLRYLQETALDAATQGGYDAPQAAALNGHWQLREVDIEYVRPLKYGDSLLVRTWVEACDETRVRHRYAFRNLHSDSEVARARADTRLLNSTTRQPLSLPSAWRAVFGEVGAWSELPFPSASPLPQQVFTIKRRVMWQDVDASHQLHPAQLLDYIEECGNQVLLAYGWPVMRMMQEGFGIILRRMQVEFLQPIRLDDELTIATWASEIKRLTAVRYYNFIRDADQALVARAHVPGVWLNTTTMQPIRIPSQFLSDFAPNLVL